MLALLLAALSLVASAQDPPTITPAEAAKHVGELVVVQGTIDQITLTVNLTTHINFGGRYPNHVFTATILKAKQALFAGVKGYEGKVVQVRGVVRLYRGKPEIMLSEASQLSAPVDTEQPAAPPAASAAPSEPPASTIADLRFDAQGADFSAWVANFNKSVKQEWQMPEAVLTGGAHGNVDFEFMVERDGSLSAVRMRKSSGTSSLDRAAAKALTISRQLPLPQDFLQQNVMMQVSFVYSESKK